MLLHMKKQQSGLYAHTINVALFGQLLHGGADAPRRMEDGGGAAS